MILRPFDSTAGDASRLAGFSCSTGQPYEDEVETWITTRAVAWLNDVPRTTFQRRALALVEDGDELVAVVAAKTMPLRIALALWAWFLGCLALALAF